MDEVWGPAGEPVTVSGVPASVPARPGGTGELGSPRKGPRVWLLVAACTRDASSARALGQDPCGLIRQS